MLKRQIEAAGLSGLPLTFADVARISRVQPTVIQLRHSWPENVDGRIWSAIRRTLDKGAQRHANAIGKPVEAYNVQGNVIGAYEPDKEPSC
jgi:hypothetical protein